MIVVPPSIFDDLKLTVPEGTSDTVSLSSEVDEYDYSPGTVTPDERSGDRFFGIFPNSPSYLDYPYPRGLRVKNTFVEFERTSELTQVTRMRTWPMSQMDEFRMDVITLQSNNDKLRRPSLDSDSQPMSPSSIRANRGRKRIATRRAGERTESALEKKTKLLLDKSSHSKSHQSCRRHHNDKNVDAMEPMETYEKDEKKMERTWEATTQNNHKPSSLEAHLKQEHQQQRKLHGRRSGKEWAGDYYYGAGDGGDEMGMYHQHENWRNQDGRMLEHRNYHPKASPPFSHSHFETNHTDTMMSCAHRTHGMRQQFSNHRTHEEEKHKKWDTMMPCAHREQHVIKQQQFSNHRIMHDDGEKHKKCIGGDNSGDREGGSKAKSTIMVRNIARKCTQRMLAMDLDMGGFKKQFDFIYLPFCFETKSNVGYAFINFITGYIADKFINYWNRKLYSNISSRRIISDRRALTATYADVQGLDDNVDRLVGDYKIARIHNPRYQPSIFLDGVRVNFQKYTESLKAKKQTNTVTDDQPNTTCDEKTGAGQEVMSNVGTDGSSSD